MFRNLKDIHSEGNGVALLHKRRSNGQILPARVPTINAETTPTFGAIAEVGTRMFAIVLARDKSGVAEKQAELQGLCLPHLIICGERLDLENVVYRTPRGKYDAINFAMRHLPDDAEIVILNDVDTKIVNFWRGLRHFRDQSVGLVFTSVELPTGAHSTFNNLIDSVRAHLMIAANGELMFFRRNVLDKVGELEPCKAEDTLMMFKTLALGYRVVFERECHVITSRTSTSSLKNEELFKRKVVCGIYQAIHLGAAPLAVKIFYGMLPFGSLLLLVSGRKGWYWMRGILFGLIDFLRGDRRGFWLPTYKG